jgi:hypothetical protein
VRQHGSPKIYTQGKKRKNEKVRINVNPSDDLPSISIIKGFVAAYQFEARVNRGSQLTATGS